MYTWHITNGGTMLVIGQVSIWSDHGMIIWMVITTLIYIRQLERGQVVECDQGDPFEVDNLAHYVTSITPMELLT